MTKKSKKMDLTDRYTWYQLFEEISEHVLVEKDYNKEGKAFALFVDADEVSRLVANTFKTFKSFKK